MLDVEVVLADAAGVCIRYWLQSAEYTIALSTLYQLLLPNPQRGCSILSGVERVETVPAPKGHLDGEYAMLS